MSSQRPLSTHILRNYMLEVMGDAEFCRKHSNRYEYLQTSGSDQHTLFWLVEIMAIEKQLVNEDKKPSVSAWSSPRHLICNEEYTNFTLIEIQRLWEAFNTLLNNYIIAPGYYGGFSNLNLPYFHITENGRDCINALDVLPYDLDEYLKMLNEIEGLDEWVGFYMYEALKCFNASCYNAATAMIGLSSEVLVEQLIKQFSKLLDNTIYRFQSKGSLKNDLSQNEKLLMEFFDDKIRKAYLISAKYEVFNYFFVNIENMPQKLIDVMDSSARNSFSSFIRLNRNEVSNCMEVKKDMSETFLIFMGFTKYCSLLTNMINTIKEFNGSKKNSAVVQTPLFYYQRTRQPPWAYNLLLNC